MVTGKYFVQLWQVQNTGSNKLQNAAEIFSPAYGKGNGNQMFRLHNADWDAFCIGGLSTDNGLLLQWAGGGQKLHGPVSNPNVFSFSLITEWQQIIVDR